jgi:hypothetical protein
MTQSAQRAIAQSKAKRQQHHIGQTIKTSLFGRMVEGKIVAVHPFGTVDIDIGKDCYYRVSGLTLTEATQ